MNMIYANFSEDLIRCWCFDCSKIFFTDGNAPVGFTVCAYCQKKNYDFDMNFRYSGRRRQQAAKQHQIKI